MKQVLAAVLGAGLLLAGCGQNTPAATASSGAPVATYGDGLDHSWTASTAEGQRLYAALSQGLKAQDFNIGLSITATSGWGPIELNTSNGETPAGDGKPITLNGQVYSTGLGLHANSEIHIHATNLETPACTRFQADVGLDDEVGDKGSVVFQVFADGVKLFDSGVMTGASATQHINVGIGNKSDLRFVVTDAGDNNYYDHADWAGASISCAAPAQSAYPEVASMSPTLELGNPDPSAQPNVLPTTVTITGQYLQNASVSFGQFGAGKNLVVNESGTQLTVLAPSYQTGSVPVVVTTPYGKVLAGFYYFRQGDLQEYLRILDIQPRSGPEVGGNLVTFRLKDVATFYQCYAGPCTPVPAEPILVYFGTTKAEIVTTKSEVIQGSTGLLLTVKAPPGTGTVDVRIVCNGMCQRGKETDAVPYRYLPY